MIRPARFRRGARLVAVLGLLASVPAPLAATNESDPLERLNRPIFWLNEKADSWILEPVARGWNWVVPRPAQRAVSRFFRNLESPTLVFNNLLQGKPHQAAVDLTRFAFNSTFGIAGLFDPAASWGLERREEDFGQTLGVWGVPPGPYLMLPLLGPATLRDGVARPMETATAIYPWFVAGVDTIGLTVVDNVNWRSLSLEQIAALKESSLDLYVAVRNGYLQRRRALVADRTEVSADDDEDLYFFEEDDE